MDDKQELLAELLKIKSFLLGMLANHNLVVHPSDVLDKINKAIELVKESK